MLSKLPCFVGKSIRRPRRTERRKNWESVVAGGPSTEQTTLQRRMLLAGGRRPPIEREFEIVSTKLRVFGHSEDLQANALDLNPHAGLDWSIGHDAKTGFGCSD